MPDKKNYAMDTLLTHAGNRPEANHGIVNPPVYHASTVLYRPSSRWNGRRGIAFPASSTAAG